MTRLKAKILARAPRLVEENRTRFEEAWNVYFA